MFPAITDAWRSFKAGLGSQPEPLSLKGTTGMNLLDPAWYPRNGYPNMAAAWGAGASSWSGESINNDTSLNHSVVWCCRRIISESVAGMPLELMQAKNGARGPAKNLPLYSLLHDEPNAEQSDMEFRELLTDRTVSGGNSYAKIGRRSGSGTAIELNLIPPAAVNVDRDSKGRLVYVVKEDSSQGKTYTVEWGKPHDILHIRGLGSDGMRGYSVLHMARQSMGTAIAAERRMGEFFRNGARVPYNLKLSQKFKDSAEFERFRDDWETVYRDPHKVPILEPWLEYQQTGISMADAQMLETRMFEIPEICRWFLITPHMVGDLSRGTFSNIENLYLQHLKGCLNGWIKREEKAFWRCLLTPEEKEQGYYFKHNVNALLRGDYATRMAGYASALQNGHLNIDEVRDLEDRNPLPEGAGQAYHVQLNMGTVPGTGDPLTAERQSSALVQLSPKPAKAAPEIKAALPPAPHPAPVFNLQIQQPNIEVNVPPANVHVAPAQINSPVALNLAIAGKKKQTMKRDKNGLLESIENEEVNGPSEFHLALNGKKKQIVKRDERGRLEAVEIE